MDDLFSSPASATAAAAAGSLQTSNAGDLGAVGGADNSSTHRAPTRRSLSLGTRTGIFLIINTV